MLKTRARTTASQPADRTRRITGINLPTETWELLRRVAFGRSRKFGDRGSVSDPPVELMERHKRGPKKELASAIR